ncbi:hypothetical protein LEN26_009953, partial [Aphanomyces euteiches]
MSRSYSVLAKDPIFIYILPKTIVDFTEDSSEKKRENPSLHAIHREFNLENATTESTSTTASNQDESNDIPQPHKTVSFKPILTARLAKVATIRGLSESKKADRARHITWQEENTISDRCLASEECNLEMTVENHKAEKIRDCQIINQLHGTVHESNEYKQLLEKHEDTINEWNASQMVSEDQLSRAREQLERLNQQL